MRLFLALTRRSLQRHLTYRAAAVAGTITNVFFGWLRAVVMIALYGERDSFAGYGLDDAITYTGLTQAVIGYLAIFGWYDLMRTVHSGEIATDLLRPMRLVTRWLADDLGRALVALVLRGLPIMLIYALAVDLTVPGDPWQWTALGLALTLSWLVGFAWRFLVNLAAFWSPNAFGIGRFGFIAGWFFSGFLMPLDFFPVWVQRIAVLTPFPAMLDTVVEVWLGIVRGPELAAALLTQAAWALALLAAGQLVLRFGVRRLVVLGG